MEEIGMGNASAQCNARRQEMREPEEVVAMLRLHRLGWGSKRIAAQLGCSRNTVKRYLRLGGWRASQMPPRTRQLAGLEAWLAERFERHRGNADVIRQELIAEHEVTVSLRTVERAVKPLRREWLAQALATVRFETPPGLQMQIDFGERTVMIAGQRERIYLFVATLGYSRRMHVRVFEHERQASWFDGMESAFAAFGGVTGEVLLDNARALVVHHDAVTREVQFNDRLLAFAKHWGFAPRACAPYRARTKGKDERGVGYVKRNAIAGREFASFAALEAHLEQWVREIADLRVHGTTGEVPALRFACSEATALTSVAGKPPFAAVRVLQRRVQADCCIEIERNAYSVPWRLIGEPVHVELGGGRIRIYHAGRKIAEHVERVGRRERSVLAEHFAGVAGAQPSAAMAITANELLRPLAEYAALAGGSW
jgi:transposase